MQYISKPLTLQGWSQLPPGVSPEEVMGALAGWPG
jgi:hypothetical protein